MPKKDLQDISSLFEDIFSVVSPIVSICIGLGIFAGVVLDIYLVNLVAADGTRYYPIRGMIYVLILIVGGFAFLGLVVGAALDVLFSMIMGKSDDKSQKKRRKRPPRY